MDLVDDNKGSSAIEEKNWCIPSYGGGNVKGDILSAWVFNKSGTGTVCPEQAIQQRELETGHIKEECCHDLRLT